MSSKSIVNYKPLVRVEDFHGNVYYSECSYADMVQMRTQQELIDFSFSGDCVKTSHIVRHRVADQEEVIFAWLSQNLTFSQRNSLNAGIEQFNQKWKYTRPITEDMLRIMIERIKNGETPIPSNGVN